MGSAPEPAADLSLALLRDGCRSAKQAGATLQNFSQEWRDLRREEGKEGFGAAQAKLLAHIVEVAKDLNGERLRKPREDIEANNNEVEVATLAQTWREEGRQQGIQKGVQ